MKPSTSYWKKYLLQAAIEETKDELAQQGYAVKTDVKVGNLRIDLIASKNGEDIYFEFKGKGASGHSKSELLRLKKLTDNEPNAALKFIFVSPPEQIQIEVDEIERILEEAFVEDMPDELHSLSTHTSIEDVSDVGFTHIAIATNHIRLSGYCMVSVALQYGSNSDVERDEGHVSGDSFPAEFELELDGELRLQHQEITVDTSSFFG